MPKTCRLHACACLPTPMHAYPRQCMLDHVNARLPTPLHTCARLCTLLTPPATLNSRRPTSTSVWRDAIRLSSIPISRILFTVSPPTMDFENFTPNLATNTGSQNPEVMVKLIAPRLRALPLVANPRSHLIHAGSPISRPRSHVTIIIRTTHNIPRILEEEITC